ncbi:TPA: DUF1642 domain-containing protein [Streptococcus suis]
MNKQEAMDVIESISYYEKVNGDPLEDLVNKIYDDLKPVVPKFVAEWIEYCKSNKLTLLGAFDPVSEHGIGLANTFTGEVWKGIDWAKRNQDTFARAWLNGYEVEKERLYTVEIPNPNLNTHTILQKTGKGLALITAGNAGWAEWESSKLAEAEIKQDFDWAWQFAKETENDTE